MIRNRIYEILLEPQLSSARTTQELFEFLQERFTDKALAGLCFAFRVKYDELEGSDKGARIRSLIDWFGAQSRLEELNRLIQEYR